MGSQRKESVVECSKKIKGKRCRGAIVEYRVSPNADVMMIGPGQFAGYVCSKCNKYYDTLPINLAALEKLRKRVISTFKKYSKQPKVRKPSH